MQHIVTQYRGWKTLPGDWISNRWRHQPTSAAFVRSITISVEQVFIVSLEWIFLSPISLQPAWKSWTNHILHLRHVHPRSSWCYILLHTVVPKILFATFSICQAMGTQHLFKNTKMCCTDSMDSIVLLMYNGQESHMPFQRLDFCICKGKS